jgi:hypothetical protein
MFAGASIWKFIGVGLAALALIAAIVVGVRGCKKDQFAQENQSINLGAQSERAETQGEVLNHVQAAHDAVEHPTDVDSNRVCSRYDRNCPKSH